MAKFNAPSRSNRSALGQLGHSTQAKKPVSAAKHSKAGQIRIIAGQYKGRKLPVLDVEGLRPTTDRVKETVFNWLMHDCRDSMVLDCFAGAGSLGFEAASRYAKSVTLLELDKQAAAQLTKNAKLLDKSQIDVVHTDSLRFLAQPATPIFDLVFIDPPFRKGLASEAISLLSQGWLAARALVYVETETELGLPTVPQHWQLLKEKTAGQVSYRLFLVESH